MGMKSFFRGLTFLLAFNCVGLMSCSDDEAVFSVDPDVVNAGVSTDLDGGYYDIDVKSNGKWTASLSSDCEWAMILNNEGKGNGSVTLFIEGNYTNIGRTATLTITNGDEPVSIRVSQDNTLGGQPVANGDDDRYFINVASAKGLGMGYDLKDHKTRAAVINLKAIEKLMEEDDVTYYGLYTSNPISKLEAGDVNVDSVEIKNDSLGVRLDMKIAYGTFKLGISGGFHSTEERATTAKSFKTAANYPTMEAALDYSSVAANYENWMTEGKPVYVNEAKKEKDYRASLLTPGFASKRDSVIAAIQNKANSSELASFLKILIDTYGPVVTTRSTLGGMFALECYYDSIYVKEDMALDSAKISVSIKAGLFSLDAGVAASYGKASTEILQHSTCSCVIMGGEQNGQTGIYTNFKNQTYASLNKSVGEWVKGIVTTDDKKTNNSEVISIELVPIWLFFDNTSAGVVQEYVLKRYPESGFLKNY